MLFVSQIEIINGSACTRDIQPRMFDRQMSFVAFSDEFDQILCAGDDANGMIVTRSLIECSMTCRNIPECQVFNWRITERNRCELFFYSPREINVTDGCKLFSFDARELLLTHWCLSFFFCNFS